MGANNAQHQWYRQKNGCFCVEHINEQCQQTIGWRWKNDFQTTAIELDLIFDNLTTNAITVNNKIVRTNSTVNSELDCNGMMATGKYM